MNLNPKPLNLDQLPPIELEKETLTISGNRKLYHFKIKSKHDSELRSGPKARQNSKEEQS